MFIEFAGQWINKDKIINFCFDTSKDGYVISAITDPYEMRGFEETYETIELREKRLEYLADLVHLKT